MTSKKLILTSRKILITSLLCGMIWPTFARENFSPSTNLEYASLEHLMLGADLKLHFIDMNGQSYDQNGSNVVIKQVASSDKSLFPITYAKMIYLAGDFIADPNLNISGDKSNPDNNYSLVQLKSNFLQNFNYFDGYFQGEYSGASKFLVGDFLPKIEAIVNDQLEKNKQNIINHKPLSQLDGEDFSFNCATGGKCSSQLDLLKKQGLYMAVSSKGGDHFSKYAITNYLTGHRLALETAALAKNEEALKKAYAYEAYADHYLTDAFSSGHQRTPIVDFMNLSNEKELNTLFNLPIIKNILISQGITKEYILLAFAKFMHDYDNYSGVWTMTLHNPNPWLAYGDNYMFIPENQQNIRNILLAAQHGIDQVFMAYQQPSLVTENWIDKQINEISGWLPDLKYVNESISNKAPLFSIINGYLYEPGSRDWANGSSGAVCVLKRHIASILTNQTVATVVEKALGTYCYNTIQGFTRTYDAQTASYLTDKVSSTDGKLQTTITGNTSSVFAQLGNLEEAAITPIISDNKGNSCTFKYPILIKRYGMYSSLDQQNGNTSSSELVIGSEYLNCNGNRNSVLFSAASLNENEYIGFTKNNMISTNVKLCNERSGVTYLTNAKNQCTNWR